VERRQLDEWYSVVGGDVFLFVPPLTSMMMGPQHYQDPNNWQIVSGADGASMESLGKGYARDKRRAYYAGVPLAGSHDESLTVLDGPYARNTQGVYCGAKVIQGADPLTFRADARHGSRYGWDAKRVYYASQASRSLSLLWDGAETLPASAETFVVLSADRAKDAKHVWFGATKVDADPKSFVVLSDFYSKDRKTVFFGNEPGPADASSFEVVPFSIQGQRTASFGRDARHVYYLSTVIPHADPATFVDLDGHYAKDKKSVYYRRQLLPEADRASFELLDRPIFFPKVGNAIAQDETHYYDVGAMGPIRWKKPPKE
jgi:hypothetical protein